MKNTKEQDNRVCLFYVAEKLMRLTEIKSDEDLRKHVEEFKQECVYNLGINALNGERI